MAILRTNTIYLIIISLFNQLTPVRSVGDAIESLRQTFCYVHANCGPSTWTGMCNSGALQSPINFDGIQTSIKFLLPTYRHFYSYGTAETRQFNILNTGHAVEVHFPTGSEPILKGFTIGLPGNYRFAQLHFHWGSNDKSGSEHTILGTTAALELHLVHYSTNYGSFAEASAITEDVDPNAVAIIGILYKVGLIDNDELKPIIDSIPLVREYKNSEEILVNRFLNLKAFFPSHLDFYRYQGSLTSPSCSENKIWTVFKKFNTISSQQLQMFRTVFEHDNTELLLENHRPLQPRNGRAITLYKIPFNLMDLIVQILTSIYTFINGLVTRSFKYYTKSIRELWARTMSRITFNNGFFTLRLK